MTPSEEKTTIKKGSSLAWKFSLSQLLQLVGSFLKTNLLILFIFFVCMVMWSEFEADFIYRESISQFPDTIQSDSVKIESAFVRRVPEHQGLRLRVFKSLHLQKEVESYRQIEMRPIENPLAKDIKLFSSYPSYAVFFPAGDGSYWQVNLLWELPVIFLVFGLLVLSFFQLLSLPLLTLRARNRARVLLRPIYELTTTAQSISSVDALLPLYGAIDELNTITGSRFDKRITIGDEREELQGLAQAINDMLDRLDDAYQAQLRFVSDASHELRTPISIIQGYARLLSRWGKDDPKTLQESIEAIQLEAESMQKLVEQLLFLARSDNQSIQLHPKEFDLSEMLDEVVRETLMIQDTHEVIKTIPDGIHMVGDVQLIKQATRILVDNSIKYSHEDGGRVTITLETTPEEIHIQIGDNGVGIPSNQLGNLFKRFWRADESRTRKTGGTGLGLSIAYWIAESHGGYISVVSRENVGTKFTISIPSRMDPSEKLKKLYPHPEDPAANSLEPEEDSITAL